MGDKKVLDFLIRIIIAWIGIICLISMIATRIETGVNVPILLIYTFLFCAFFVVIMYGSFLRQRLLWISLGIFAVLVILTSSIWISGINMIATDCKTIFQVYQSSDISMVEKSMNFEMSAEKNYAIFLFLSLSSIVFSTVVVYSHSMLMALLVELPMFVLLMFFNIVPPVMCFAFCIIYVFGQSALEKNKSNYRPAVIMVIVSALICFLVIGFFPKDKFKRPKLLLQMNEYIMDNWGKVFENGYFEKIVATGGLSNGDLGKVDAIEYNYEPLVSISTIKSDQSQYFPQFYGQTYENNSWSIGAEENNITKALMNMVDANQNLRNALTTKNYEDMFFKYKATIQYSNSSRRSEKDIYVNNIRNYEFFQQLANQESAYATVKYNDTNIMTQNNYALYEQQYRKKVYHDYVQVPDNVKEVVKKLLGDVSIETVSQKENYLEAVREYLANNYKYSFSPGRVPDGSDFVINFLTNNKTGYCSYFATAAVLMYRSAGIPARYVEGFVLPPTVKAAEEGDPQRVSRYNINGKTTSRDYDTCQYDLDDSYAHAWVEVYMDGYGWVTQEVTPATRENVILAQVEKAEAEQDNKRNIEETEKEEPTTSVQQEETKPAQQRNQSTTTAAQENQSNRQNSDQTVSTEMAQGFDGELNHESQLDDNNSIPKEHKLHLPDLSKVKKALPMIITILIVFSLLGVLLIRYLYSRRKRNELFAVNNPDRGQLLLMYHDLEQLLNRTGYAKQDNMDYEQYAVSMLKSNECFEHYKFDQIIQIIMKLRFSKDTAITHQEVDLVRSNILKLRKVIYHELKWYKHMWLKFFRLL